MALTFIDFFAGVGGFRSGLEQAGFTCIGFCEVDKHARKVYQALYDTSDEWTGTDITKVTGAELPNADIWTFGFPCQDVSTAGNMAGMGVGTRSGLFFEVMRLLHEREKNRLPKPRVLLAENVRNLLSIDKGRGFLNLLREMDAAGYDVQWKVYNSKDYGVPQNRERVYIAGYLRRESGGALQCTAKDDGIVFTDPVDLLPIPLQSDSKIEYAGAVTCTTYEANQRVYRLDSISSTLNTKSDNYRGIKILYGYEDDKPLIRRLTPKEHWRLQGFTDSQYDMAAALVSRGQLYKQAGNAVTVNVVKAIGNHLAEVLPCDT